jgi:hypothetical protein
MILDLHRSPPALGKRGSERARHDVGAATGPERLDQEDAVQHVLLTACRNGNSPRPRSSAITKGEPRR